MASAGLPDDGLVNSDDTAAERLERPECLRLLSGHRGGVGRLGFDAQDMPTILPVNYEMAGDDLVIRTGSGMKSVVARKGGIIAFEIDGLEDEGRTAWSVLVRGMASLISAGELVELGGPTPSPLAPVSGDTYLRVRSGVITGRRFPLRPSPSLTPPPGPDD